MEKASEKYKPSVPKKHLLIIASSAWFIGGGILMLKGIFYLFFESDRFIFEILLGIILGLAFYYFLFSKISIRHINRIFSLNISRPCLFSFFDIKSYVLMCIMISSGILLRKFDIINHEALYTFYVVMGTPLLLSALRFFYSWLRYSDSNKL
ncbi:MAG: hypothetical protein HY958_02755 [Bacteroidia bacterium]|nr:hypothetical protein [Bacteroidia bacterium]